MANQSYINDIPADSFSIYIPTTDEFYKFITIAVTSLYCFGIPSNIIILWIFYTDGFASTSNINFFSLGVTDLCICTIHVVRRFFDSIWGVCLQNTICITILRILQFISVSEAYESFSTWITALITLERLLCITSPMKVSSKL